MGCAVILMCGLVFLLIAWPYLLGTWLAVQLGAGNPSTARTATGWVFESIYLFLVASACVFAMVERSRNARLAKSREELAALERARQSEARKAEICQQLAGRISDSPGGSKYPGLASQETLLFRLDGVALYEPRVAHRGGPRVPTPVDEGEVMVTSRAVRFHSERKHVEWRLDRMIGQNESADRITWAVSNRKTVSGVGGSGLVVSIVRGLILWARALPSPDVARRYFVEEAARAAQAVAQLDTHIRAKWPEAEAVEVGARHSALEQASVE